MDECPADEITTKFTIHATMENRTHGGARVRGQLWKITIPELNVEGHTCNLTKTLAVEIAKIESSNEDVRWAESTPEEKEERHRIAARKWRQREFPEERTYDRDLSQSIHPPLGQV